MLGALKIKDKEIENVDIDVTKKESPAPDGMGFPICIGRNQKQEYIYVDMDADAHMAIGGCSRSGKTNFIEHLICSALEQKNTHVYLFDPLGDLEGYAQKKEVTCRREPEEAFEIVDYVAAQIKTKAALFAQEGIRKLSQWYSKTLLRDFLLYSTNLRIFLVTKIS